MQNLIAGFSLRLLKSKPLSSAVVVDRLEEMRMRDAEKSKVGNMALGVTAALYYVVMLAAFAVGVYGFFSLFWLATSAVGRNAQILGSPF